MDAVTYSAFRRNLKSFMRTCRDDAVTLLVINNDPTENVVVMSQRDYDSFMETARIYENPYLLNKIREGDRQVAQGNYSAHDLIEDAEDEYGAEALA